MTFPPGLRERVLVVDDEPDLRDLVEQILLTQGYSVLAAEDPNEALEFAARHPGPIDLVVTDVTMTPMSGPELVARLTASRPVLKVLYISGYLDPLDPHGILAARVAFLRKPFTPASLIREVRALLDRSAPDTPGCS
jgi:CheY-like chemotaxis protein